MRTKSRLGSWLLAKITPLRHLSVTVEIAYLDYTTERMVLTDCLPSTVPILFAAFLQVMNHIDWKTMIVSKQALLKQLVKIVNISSVVQQVITSTEVVLTTFGADTRRSLTKMRVLMLQVSFEIRFLVIRNARESPLAMRTFGDLRRFAIGRASPGIFAHSFAPPSLSWRSDRRSS
jgi:hypothetical protein